MEATRLRTLYEIKAPGPHLHQLTVALYRFHDGSEVPYLEISEAHLDYQGHRVLPLSEVVHCLMNVGDGEIFLIGNRSIDWEGRPTPR